MNNGVKMVISFTLGAVVGAAVTYKLVKTKFEQKADAEIEEMRELYSHQYANNSENEKEQYSLTDEEKEEVENDIETFEKYVEHTNKYTTSEKDHETLNNKKEYQKGGSTTMEDIKKPVIIPKAEFGENDEYELISYDYYEDDFLIDDIGDIVEDIEGTVGSAALELLRENPDENVYVRNDELMRYYEIVFTFEQYESDYDIYADPSVDE